MLQRVVRLRRGRNRVMTIRRLYHAALDRKRMCLYRFLRRLHIAYAGTGRTLVKFRLVKPENVPEMPENEAFDLKGYQRKIKAQLNAELDEMFTKHHGDLLKDIARGAVKADEVLRWRRRNQRNLLFSSIKSFFNKHIFFKMAEKLMLDAEKIDLNDPDATESRPLKVLAKVFGGKDFMYDKDDRRAWAGVHSFKDMSRSPHIVHNKWFPVTGTAIVHGVWVDDKPHGEGTIWFPTGTTLNGDVFAKPVDWELQLRDRTGDTGGRRGEKARRWKQYEEIFCKNIEKGNIAGKHVTITYRNGERYEGPFMPYGRQPPREHRGVWFKTNGWEYRGANVTNHFDSTRITGYYTVKTSKGSTYDGYVHLNKRHGYGRMRFANGNEYSGEWRLGIKHGFGTFKDTEGNIYTGDWVNDKMHGVGMDRRADGRIYKGTIVDGKWHQNGVLRVPSKRFPNSGSGMDQYTAYFQYGFVHGEGELLFANGDRYVGPFRKNMRKGVGVCHFVSKERYEGPYNNDEMHGVGHWIKPRGSAHDEIRIGLWKEGFHRRWLGYAVSKLITTEFLRRINEEGLDSPFAQFIVEKIPDLPQGVDSNDPQVKELVEQIMRRQGPDASRLMMQKTQTEHTKQGKFLTAGRREHDIAHQRLRDTTMQLQKQRRIVLEQKRLLEELKKDKTRLERQIERFWVDDDYENRKKFLKTIPPIQMLSRQDWYRLSSAPDVNDALKALLVVGVCSLLGLPNTWKEVQLLCGDSDQNRIANDRDAFLYTYANKFVFLSKKFDPFVVASDEDQCEILEKVFYLPNVRPSNPDIFSQALAAARICSWFRRATCLVRKAKNALETWKEFNDVKFKLETEIDINHEELDLLRELENKVEDDQHSADVADNVYKQLQEKQAYLTHLIDTIEQNAVDLTKFQIMDQLEIDDMGAAIERGEIDIDAIFLKGSTHQVRAIKSFIQAGFPVDSKDKHGNTLLHVACEQVDIEMAQMLVQSGHCDINAINEIGNTPLHYALMYGADTSLGPWLIKKGADDTIVNKMGNTVYDGIGKDKRRALEEHKKLQDAIEAKRSEETGLGGELGKFPFDESDDEEDENAPLLKYSHNTAVVPKPAGPPPKAMDTSVESTIEEAFAKCAEGDAATVLRYIDNNYNTFGVKVTDDDGNTALLATAKGISGSNIYKYQGLMSSLLLRGANINHQNKDGNTALHYAFARDTSGAVAGFLIEKGAKDQLCNNYGLSPYDGLDLFSAVGGGIDHAW